VFLSPLLFQVMTAPQGMTDGMIAKDRKGGDAAGGWLLGRLGSSGNGRRMDMADILTRS
jgi:hypothetical protein